MCPPGSGVGSGQWPGPDISCPRGLWVTSGPKARTRGWNSGWDR